VRLSLNFFLAATLLVSAPAAAQTAAPLSGSVVDSTGAVVPGAAVTLRRSAGAVVRATSTDAAGRYAIVGVEPGDYVVTAALEGFSLAEAAVVLRATPITQDLTLLPGSLAEDLTVIGSRLVGSEEMRRRVPGSFDLITRDALTASHVFTTNEALRKVPGVTVRDEEGLGLRPNIGMRGLNPTRSTKVLLLEDGLPTSFAPYGDNASYYHPPIERFERIEVLKGSSQIAHGPVTLGGVINYITPDAPARPAFAVDLTGGNRSYGNLGGSFGGTWARTGVFTQAVRKQSDGARDNTHSDLTDLMVKLSPSFGATQQLSVKGNYYGEDSQLTYSGLRDAEYAAAVRQNPFANDAFEGDRAGVSATYRALAWSRVAFTGTAYTTRFGRDWWRQSSNSNQRPNDAADPACGGMANLNTTCGNEGRLRRYRTTGAEARARVAFEAGSAQETDFGVRLHAEHQDRRQENGATPLARSGVLVEDNERTTDALAAFVQHRVLAGAWTVTPGVRVERITYTRANRLLGVTGETDLTEVVPGFGVSYGVAAESTIFAGVHRGFAPPRAEDIINNTTGGTVDLDPERSWNYELGGRTRAGDALRFDATLFRLDYQNQIVPASLAGGSGATLTNGGETLHQGVEIGTDGDWRRMVGSAHDLYTRVALTWLPVAKFTGVRTSNIPGFATVSVSGNRLPYAPETTATVTLGYRHRTGVDVQIESQYVGEQFTDDLNTVAGTVDGQRGLMPAFTVWNLAASWRIPGVGGSIFLAVKNLADEVFIVDRSRGILPGHPRLVQIGTSWRF
jgi:Fe(3+) dicitrate transport protein